MGRRRMPRKRRTWIMEMADEKKRLRDSTSSISRAGKTAPCRKGFFFFIYIVVTSDSTLIYIPLAYFAHRRRRRRFGEGRFSRLSEMHWWNIWWIDNKPFRWIGAWCSWWISDVIGEVTDKSQIIDCRFHREFQGHGVGLGIGAGLGVGLGAGLGLPKVVVCELAFVRHSANNQFLLRETNSLIKIINKVDWIKTI